MKEMDTIQTATSMVNKPKFHVLNIIVAYPSHLEYVYGPDNHDEPLFVV